MSNEENTAIRAYTRSWLIGITLILLGFLALLIMLGWFEGLAIMALFGGVAMIAFMVFIYSYLNPQPVWTGWFSYLLFTVALYFGVAFLFDFSLKYYGAWGVFLAGTPFMVLYIRRVLLADEDDPEQKKLKDSLWWTALVTGGLYTTAIAILQFLLGWPYWLLPGVVTTVFMGGMTGTFYMIWLPNRSNETFTWLIPIMIITGLLTGVGVLLTVDLLMLTLPILLLLIGAIILVIVFIRAYLRRPAPPETSDSPRPSSSVTPFVEQLPPPTAAGRALAPGEPVQASPTPEPNTPIPTPEGPPVEIDEALNLDPQERPFAAEDRRFTPPPLQLPESNLMLAAGPESTSPTFDVPDTLPEERTARQIIDGKRTIALTSAKLADRQPIPKVYTACWGGENISPPLQWQHIPAGTATLALICTSPDAPGGIFTHWLLYNLPPDVHELPAAVAPSRFAGVGGIQGRNDYGNMGYDGPNPKTGQAYHYQFQLYALNKLLPLAPGANRSQFMESFETGNILAWGMLTVTCQG